MAITKAKPPAANFTLEDRKKLCNAWAKTNLSRSEFIRRHELPKSFHYWCNKLLPPTQTKELENHGKWLQVVPHEEVESNCNANLPIANDMGVELIQVNLFCNDLKFNISLPIERVITFVKEISNATTVIR